MQSEPLSESGEDIVTVKLLCDDYSRILSPDLVDSGKLPIRIPEMLASRRVYSRDLDSEKTTFRAMCSRIFPTAKYQIVHFSWRKLRSHSNYAGQPNANLHLYFTYHNDFSVENFNNVLK
jgi:hypothetical protein